MSNLGCLRSNSPAPSPPTDSTFELTSNTFEIDTATSNTIKSVDSTTIIFSGGTTQLQKLKVGDIIISGIAKNAPFGFLRKITQIQENGSTFTLTTTEVPLTDAFKELHVDYTKTYSAGDTLKMTPAGINFDVPILNTILYDADGNYNTTFDQIKVNGDLTLTPQIHVKIDIGLNGLVPTLKDARIECNFEGAANLSVTAGGSLGTISKEINIFSKPLALFLIPYTPLVVVPNLRVRLGAEGSVNADVTASEINSINITSFLEYSNSTWDKGYSQTMQNQFTFSGLNGNASAKVYVEPAIDFKLYNSNWAKGSISAQAYIEASGQIAPTQSCELKAGVSAGAEANLKLFGWAFTEASYPSIFDYSKVLYTCPSNISIPTVTPTAISSVTETAAQSGGNITSDGGAQVTARGVCWSTSASPTIANNTTTDGTGTGTFTSSLTGLTANTTYYVRAYATNTTGTGYGNQITFTTQQGQPTITDIDGNVYNTVTIGTQVWLKENLKTSHYRNGDPIPQVTDNSQWDNSTTGAWCYFNNDPANGVIYGRLYNWYTVNDPRGLAPQGWHIPTITEWNSLSTFLGGASVAGGKMKATTLWISPNTGATNESGFSGLPGSSRQYGVFYGTPGYTGEWLSSTSGEIWYLVNSYSSTGSTGVDPTFGVSVRCVKD